MHTEEIAQGLSSDPDCNYNKLPAPPQQKTFRHQEESFKEIPNSSTFKALA